MLKVTFQASYPVKQGRRWVQKVSQWDEMVKTEADAKIRANALNWVIVKIEKV